MTSGPGWGLWGVPLTNMEIWRRSRFFVGKIMNPRYQRLGMSFDQELWWRTKSKRNLKELTFKENKRDLKIKSAKEKTKRQKSRGKENFKKKLWSTESKNSTAQSFQVGQGLSIWLLWALERSYKYWSSNFSLNLWLCWNFMIPNSFYKVCPEHLKEMSLLLK